MSVYLIEAAGANLLKIGYAINPARRIKTIATACPFPVVILGIREGGQQLERAMHLAQSARRFHLEWFRKWDDALAWFETFDGQAARPLTLGGTMDISHIPERVRYALKQGETPASLAKKAGLHRNTLYGCESERWNPTLDTLTKLAPHLPELPARPRKAAA